MLRRFPVDGGVTGTAAAATVDAVAADTTRAEGKECPAASADTTRVEGEECPAVAMVMLSFLPLLLLLPVRFVDADGEEGNRSSARSAAACSSSASLVRVKGSGVVFDN